MKKYIKPDLNIVNIEVQQILAGSPLDKDTSEQINDNDAVLSRRGGHGFWDDDEE